MTWAIGFDPGFRALGVCLLNLETGIASLRIYDIATQHGKLHAIKAPDHGTLIYDVIRDLEPYLADTRCVGIERQPSIGTRDVLSIQCHLESAIRGFNYRIHIYIINPHSVRAYWDTHGKSYNQRKSNSTRTPMLNKGDSLRARQVFFRTYAGGKGKSKVDAIEAAQLCIYMVENFEKLRHPPVGQNPRKFASHQMEARVSTPFGKRPGRRLAPHEPAPDSDDDDESFIMPDSDESDPEEGEEEEEEPHRKKHRASAPSSDASESDHN